RLGKLHAIDLGWAGAGPTEDDFAYAGQHPDLIQYDGQRGAHRDGVADQAEVPAEPVVAGARQSKCYLAQWTRLDLIQREGARVLDQAGKLQPPGLWVDGRLIVMDDGEEVVGGRNPGAQILPMQQVADPLRDRVRSRLVQPGDDLL